jgi:hypothetical protein
MSFVDDDQGRAGAREAFAATVSFDVVETDDRVRIGVK